MASPSRESSGRPRIEVVSGSPTDTELAAVVIAVERLLGEDAAAGASAGPGSRWQRAALLEGVATSEAAGARWA